MVRADAGLPTSVGGAGWLSDAVHMVHLVVPLRFTVCVGRDLLLPGPGVASVVGSGLVDCTAVSKCEERLRVTKATRLKRKGNPWLARKDACMGFMANDLHGNRAEWKPAGSSC